MPRDLNAIWEAIKGNAGNAWKIASNKSGWVGARSIYRSAGLAGPTSKDARYAVGMASRAMGGGLLMGAVGGAWGAVSDRESIIGGAVKGAFVGAVGATALSNFKPNLSGKFRSLRGLNKVRLTNVRGMRKNLNNAWAFMSSKKNQGMRNWIVGMGVLGVARGMTSGEDNPIGGGLGGAVGGGIQGAAIYGGYRGIKATGLLNRFKI